MLKTCLLGLGRTGAVVAEQLLRSEDFDLVSVIGKPGSSKAGRPLSEVLNYPGDLVIADAANLQSEIHQQHFRVAIDFTTPEATLKNARILAENGVHMVIGTTGFNNMQLHELRNLVQQYRVGLVYAPNISVGINLLLSIVKTVTRLIPQYDVEITESCHRDKIDAPSGTALKIANEISLIRQATVNGRISFGRKGNKPRGDEEIGIHSIRAGGIVGVHQVLFAGEADELEITHRSYSRAIFAEGALKAAAFIAGLKGFYHMEDVLLSERMERDIRVAANRLYLNFN
ncbi:dihydrodipicolinate reductase [Hydrogenispora ethanolica]|uniref:4-hydroxy-tetrahydrodipicolinate reductase n=1 Tax=Hydrogenispora ethanolica TaxID=1082276 RepID=A0A4R1RZZ3_HYDET|nr:4-hydroxy-tetrahydrodipicolinate reductase [Hydrogenispora ethanolica]TCL72435.1 dihydrodipicolinate reductase [Hydrogenispora ethanolica]